MSKVINKKLTMSEIQELKTSVEKLKEKREAITKEIKSIKQTILESRGLEKPVE